MPLWLTPPGAEDCAGTTLEFADLVKLLDADGWRDPAALTRVLGGGALAGHLPGPGIAAFSVLRPGACIRRSLVLPGTTPPALIAFDALVSPAQKRWRLTGLDRPAVRGATWSAARVSGRTLLPGAGELSLTATADRLEAVSTKPGNEAFFLNVLQFTDGTPAACEEIYTVDLAGVRFGNRVVLFHTDVASAFSALYFDIAGPGTFRYLLSGLAAGEWDIWRDGFLERVQEPLRPGAGALYFEGPAGGYFLRRLN